MSTDSRREIFFSFFMFTADLKPENASSDNPTYTNILIKHLRALIDMGYDGFDLHIAPRKASVDPQHDTETLQLEVESYACLKDAFDKAGLKKVKFTTNVGTTQVFDPTSPYKEQRERSLRYLKSRVDITSVLGGESIMSGPFIYPYGVFPLSDPDEEPIWSDALQDWMKARYEVAHPVIEELAAFAQEKRVKLAIEPVKNWETPPPNMVSEVLTFLDKFMAPCGVTIDTAQVLMESQGLTKFKDNVACAAEYDRLNYVHISAPDRGAIHDSWIPWDITLGQIEPVYHGPYLIEVFNAIPPFDSSMRMTRQRFWRPGEDDDGKPSLSAYFIAKAALKELRDQITLRRANLPRP